MSGAQTIEVELAGGVRHIVKNITHIDMNGALCLYEDAATKKIVFVAASGEWRTWRVVPDKEPSGAVVTGVESRVLGFLIGHPDSTLRNIIDNVNGSTAAVGAAVQGLRAAGYVLRSDDATRTTYRVAS